VFFADRTRLAVLVGGEEEAVAIDSALAYGLAHAGERSLAVVLPGGTQRATVARAALLSRPVEAWAHDGSAVRRIPLPVFRRPMTFPAQDDFLAELREKALRGGEHDLGDRGAWVGTLTSWADQHPDLDANHRGTYRTWHCHGRQLLRLRRPGRGLEIVAGVDRSDTGPSDTLPIIMALDGPLDDAAAARIRALIEIGIADRLDGKDVGHSEHRLQAALASRWDKLGWPATRRLEREVPARRPGGRTAYIDFVTVDQAGLLHIIETKIGDDEFLVLQGLDYWLWAAANADLLADRFGLEQLTGIKIDFVLGELDGTTPDEKAPVLSSYAPAQLEALASDIAWEVHRLAGWPSPHCGRSAPATSPTSRTSDAARYLRPHGHERRAGSELEIDRYESGARLQRGDGHDHPRVADEPAEPLLLGRTWRLPGNTNPAPADDSPGCDASTSRPTIHRGSW
jgi:hypothetical protein